MSDMSHSTYIGSDTSCSISESEAQTFNFPRGTGDRAGSLSFGMLLCLLLVPVFASGIAGCRTAHCTAPTAFGNLGHQVNSPRDDYAPVLQDTATLIFTSNRVRHGGTGLQGALDERQPAGLLLTMRLGMDWDEAQKYEILFGTHRERELATIAFPPVPNALNALAYVTGCDGEPGGCDILIVSANENEGALNPGPGLNSPDWDGQPFVTADGRRLYFVSDRSGGYGGTDIWYVDREESGFWGQPRNAGKQVNTAGDEMSPFVDSASGSLFFASANPPNGLDIFVLDPDSEERRLLPSPYNSPADDFTPFRQGNRLYLASNREGGCGGYDLYAFSIVD